MQVFELYFNPQKKKKIIFDAFYYKPSNIYQNRLGSLFMLGELRNTAFSESRLLKNLSRVINTSFYTLKSFTPERHLKKSLKQANAFLQELIENNDVSWLSNLDFIVLSLAPISDKQSSIKVNNVRRYKLSLSRAGNGKVVVIRKGKILNIGDKLSAEDIEPYPIKVFSKIVSGNIHSGDRILLFSQEIYEIFCRKHFLKDIADIDFLNQREIDKVLKDFDENILGTCLLIDLSTDEKGSEKQKIIFKKKISILEYLPKLNISKLNIPKLNISKIKLHAFPFPDISFNSNKINLYLLKISNFQVPAFSTNFSLEKFCEKIRSFFLKIRSLFTRKMILSFFSLCFCLILGNIVAKRESIKKIEQVNADIIVIQNNIERANQLLDLGSQKEANNLLIKTYGALNILLKDNNLFSHQDIAFIKKEIEQELTILNKLKIIEEPFLVFEFNREEFIPQKIALFENNLYCFNSFVKKFAWLEGLGDNGQRNIKSHFLETELKINNGLPLENGNIVLFSQPSRFMTLENNQISDLRGLNESSLGSNFKNPISLNSNLYFWDPKEHCVFEYRYLGDSKWSQPLLFVKEKVSFLNQSKIKSIAIDKNIWVLKQDNVIDHYIAGKFQESILLNIFPLIKGLTKIWTSPDVSYLYILEPAQNRILVIDKKTFQVVKQYQSDKFNSLKDFVVSKDGTKVYLLNSLKIYQVDIFGEK